LTKIELITEINAPIELCFDLSLNVELHQQSTSKTKEFVLEGRKKGIFEEGEVVTWRAKHFGIWQNLTGKIVKVESPNYFIDEMLKGAFKSLKHLHTFEYKDGVTIMKDVLEYETPYGIFGKMFDKLILTNYMKNFLKERNSFLKKAAESELHKKFIVK